MKFDISTFIFDDKQDIAEQLSSLPVAALFLDESMKIVYKYKPKKFPKLKFRKGASIQSYLDQKDFDAISNMTMGDVFHTKIYSNEQYLSVEAIACDWGIIIFLDADCTDMVEAAEETCGRLSGYDIAIKYSSALSIGSNDERVKNTAELFRNTLRDCLYINRRTLFDAKTILNAVIDRITAISQRMSKSIIINDISGELYTSGSERNFAFIMAYLFSFSLGPQRKNRVTLDMEHQNDECIFRIVASTSYNESELNEIMNHKNKADFSGKFSELKFQLYSVKLIAEANGWYFMSMPFSENRVGFILKFPVTKSLEKYYFYDIAPKYVDEIVSILFV